METANRRATIQKMSGIPGYADGGPVSPWSIKGIANTVKGAFTESPEAAKVRRDKEYADQKAAVAARQPAPTQQAAPQAPKAITTYAAGGPSAAQLLANPEAKANGGPITGPGGPTDDQVPIMASPGEFVIKASAAKKIGIGALEALNSLGDEKAGAAKAKKQGKFYGGGDIEKEGSTINKYGSEIANAPGAGAQLANQTASYVAGAQAANPPTAQPAALQSVPKPSGPVSTPSYDQMGNATGQSEMVTPTQMGYGEQMRNVAGLAGDAFKTLISAPGYGLNKPEAPNSPSNAPVPMTNGAQFQPSKDPNYAGSAPAAPSVPTPTGPQQGIYTPNGPTPLGANAPGMAGIQARQDAGDQAYAQKRGYDAQVAEAQAINADGRRMNLEYDVRNSTGGARKAALAMLSGDREAAAGKQQAETNKRIGDQNNQLARDQLANTTSSTKLDNESKSQMLAAQKQLQAAKTPEERVAAEDNLRALQGKYEKPVPVKFTSMNLPDSVSDQGQVVRGGQVLVNSDGQIINQPNQAKANPNAPTTKEAYDKLPKGAKYTHPDGTTRTKG